MDENKVAQGREGSLALVNFDPSLASSGLLDGSHPLLLGAQRVTDAIVWVRTAMGVCRWVNNAWAEFFGEPRECAYGFGWAGRIHEYQRALVFSACATAGMRGEPMRLWPHYQLRDGTYRRVEEAGWPLRIPSAQLGYDGTPGAGYLYLGVSLERAGGRLELLQLPVLIAELTRLSPKQTRKDSGLAMTRGTDELAERRARRAGACGEWP